MRFLILVLSFLFSTIALGENLKLSGGSVEFNVESTSGLVKINGKGAKPSGSLDVTGGKASGIISVDLKPFSTENDLRDKHMHEKYLETAKFPAATLKLAPVALGASEFNWTGDLTIKGVSKPVKGTAVFRDGLIAAKFTISINDYPSIGVPSWLGVTVAKTVDVKVVAKVN